MVIGLGINEIRTETNICNVKCNKKQLQHFFECHTIFYGTLKSNIDHGRWPWSILLLSVKIKVIREEAKAYKLA